MNYKVKDILHLEVLPALGCTEPVAVALCAAAAASLLPGKELSSVSLWVSRNIYKNAMGVAIPGHRVNSASIWLPPWAYSEGIPI